MSMDPMSIWMCQEALLREARFHSAQYRTNRAIDFVAVARNLGELHPDHEKLAAEIEKRHEFIYGKAA